MLQWHCQRNQGEFGYRQSIFCLCLLGAIFLLGGCSGTSPRTENRSQEPVPCPSSPNCASTQDVGRQPLPVSGGIELALNQLATAIALQPRCEVVERQAEYLRGECKSPLFRFVDDVEAWVVNDHIQVRSAARLGYSDFGVNARRLDAIIGDYVRLHSTGQGERHQ